MDRKQQREQWVKNINKATLPDYKRRPGPPQPVLTLADAEKIYNVANVDRSYDKYKSRIFNYMVEISEVTDPTERVPVNELIEEASSICGKELNNFKPTSESFTEDQKKILEYSIALSLVNGYKTQYHEHFEVDPKTNEIIGLIHPHQERQPECDEFLKQQQQEKARRRFAATGEPADPYRGSQQGLGRKRRKTKKISKKSKKTLRRK